MAASRITAVAGSIPEVNGNARVTPKLGPTTGKTPTINPMQVPRSRKKTFVPERASRNPCNHRSMDIYQLLVAPCRAYIRSAHVDDLGARKFLHGGFYFGSDGIGVGCNHFEFRVLHLLDKLRIVDCPLYG